MRKVKIMGILNATPDSFFEGSRIKPEKVQDLAGKMLMDGADILDVGGQSTRPGAIPVSAEEEINRVLPVITSLVNAFPESIISVDTLYSKVARHALDAGAKMVNDISAGEDDEDMLALVANAGIPYVAMHKQGNPQNMQDNPTYTDVVAEVMDYFKEKDKRYTRLGIQDWILDPGFGFGKTLAHNYWLLKNLAEFKQLNKPILVGISRKSMIWKTLHTTPENALNGTTALHMAALINGADILRVHDVKEAAECVTLYQSLYAN